MADRRTCFIISPIGDKDTEIRKHADNLIRRVIVPSLSNYNFEVVRVDQSYANSRISDEIVGLIKSSELCVVDSGGYNPNVMYELGRRHETNRPVILLRPVGQTIVFDLKDIKHIEYNLDDVDSAIDCQNSIRGFLDEFDKQGFISSQTSISLDSILVSINRLEKRFDDLSKSLISSFSVKKQQYTSASSVRTTEIVNSLGPERGLVFCITQKLVREADQIFELVEPQLSLDLMYLYLGQLAGIGSRKAFDRISSEVISVLSNLDVDTVKSIVSGYIHCANIFGEEQVVIDEIETTITNNIISKSINSSDKAFFIIRSVSYIQD